MSRIRGRPGKRVELLRTIRHSRVARAGSLAGVIKGTGLVTAFFLQMMLARIVADPVEYGVYAWGQNLLFLLGSIIALGIPLASSRLAAVHARRGDLASLNAVSRSGTRWLALCSLGGAAAAASLVMVMPASAFDELPRRVALLAIAASPLVAFTMLHQALARARSRLTAAFLPTQVLRPLLTGLLSLAWFLWVQRAPAAGEVLVAVCSSLTLVLVIQLLIHGRQRAVRAAEKSESTATEKQSDYAPNRIMRNALPIFATRLSDLIIQHGSTFVLGILGGPLAAAGFFVAQRLAQLAAVPRQVIGSVVQPWLASAHAEEDRGQLQQVVTHAGHATLWPTLAAVTVLLLLGPFLLGLFGADYRAVFDVLAVLLAAHLLGAALGPAQQVLMMSGLQSAVMRVMGLAALCHVLALILMIPQFGALGAALASLASTAVARIGCNFLVRSRLDLDPSVLRRLKGKSQLPKHERRGR